MYMDKSNSINIYVSDGCFQTPICIDQSGLIINDTHNFGEELFTMIVPDPTDQFAGQAFTGLYFSINSSSLDVAAINYTTGKHIQFEASFFLIWLGYPVMISPNIRS